MNSTAFTVSRVVSLATVVTGVVIPGSDTDVPAVSGAMAVAHFRYHLPLEGAWTERSIWRTTPDPALKSRGDRPDRQRRLNDRVRAGAADPVWLGRR
ncbi:hypothetical protein AQF52_7947 [Streptomyces venezuelae]|nr:hypothetical protein AQF52_7947 [Streptomyces venezuelae]CUM35717.1 hypothetical protein BN2537_399 [Streptomyces venezuelae]